MNVKGKKVILIDEVSEFLRGDNIYSIPVNQKMLTTMIIRKMS